MKHCGCSKSAGSIRKFRPEQIKPEELDAILEAGTWAPTGMGAQSPVMVVVQDPEYRSPTSPG